MFLLAAPAFCLISGLLLGYLRGFQRSRFGWRANKMMLLIFIALAIFAYARDRMDVFIILVLGIATTYLCLMLGMLLGGLIGQRTGRLSSWKV